MAERYTVAVVVVGSSPIIRPEKPLTQGLFCSDVVLPPFRGESGFEPHIALWVWVIRP